MELRHLKYFARLAELRNFSEAARSLCISQSTLSSQIRQLENEINAPLFIRDTHRVELTDFAEALLPSVQRTLVEAEACMNRIRDVEELNCGTLHIGSTYTFSPFLRATVLEYMRQHPNVKINITCRCVEELMEMLSRGELDIVLSFKPTALPVGLQARITFDTRLVAVMADTHPLAQRKSLRLSELELQSLALPATGLQARSTFDQMVAGLDYRFNVRLEINDLGVLLSMVKSTHLITLLSQAAVSHEHGLAIVPLEQENCHMQGAFTIRTDSYTKIAAREFLRILCESSDFGQIMFE